MRNHPAIFGDSALFTEYPYLLPCLISGSVTLSGALLSLFLNEDGGPRDRGIRLPTEKDVGWAASSALSLPGKAFRAVLACFSPRISAGQNSPDRVALHRASSSPVGGRDEPEPPTPKPGQYGSAFNGFNPLDLRRTSTNRASGSAYGYSERRYPSIRRRSNYRAASVGTSTRYAPDYDDLEHAELNFAQRWACSTHDVVVNLLTAP